jgi:hypothetical protein
MSTTGARMVALSGLSGVSAKAHLMALAAGSTTGARLVARSGLATGTAMDHLMTDQGMPSVYSLYPPPMPEDDEPKWSTMDIVRLWLGADLSGLSAKPLQ